MLRDSGIFLRGVGRGGWGGDGLSSLVLILLDPANKMRIRKKPCNTFVGYVHKSDCAETSGNVPSDL